MRPEGMEKVFERVTLNTLERVAAELLTLLASHRIVVFHGEMGSGKTTLIKAMTKMMGSTDSTSSPTFSIINEYSNPQGDRIFHFDFYRIAREAEAYDIGTEEFFDSGHYCFVEWPEKIPTLLHDEYANIFNTVE
jgi:tRNA threonylcarbamoyladenosine biosynthesis protein TsaE